MGSARAGPAAGSWDRTAPHASTPDGVAAGKSLAEARDFLGHANVSITSLYTNAVIDEDAPRIAAFDGLRNGK